MRKAVIIVVLLFTLPLVWAGGAQAQTKESGVRPLKVGYVDLTRVLQEYPRQQEMEDQIKKLQDDLNRDGQVRMAEVNRMRQEIEQLAKGTPERLDLERKAQQAIMELRNAMQENQKLVDARLAEMLRSLYKDVTDEVASIGREEGYDFILKDQTINQASATRRQLVFDISQRIVLYAKPEYDISDSVIKRLAKKYAAKTGAAAKSDKAVAK